jgi:hypothetical protein
MMNNNNVPTAAVDVNGTEAENGKDVNPLSNDNGSATRSFGLVNLWSIRRNARKFRIHGRMPRL